MIYNTNVGRYLAMEFQNKLYKSLISCWRDAMMKPHTNVTISASILPMQIAWVFYELLIAVADVSFMAFGTSV